VNERLPEPVEVSAYYVIAEALTNAAKHARAATVSVQLEVAGDVLLLAIRDDGAGAPISPAAPAWPASRTGWRRSAAGSSSTARPGRAPACTWNSPHRLQRRRHHPLALDEPTITSSWPAWGSCCRRSCCCGVHRVAAGDQTALRLAWRWSQGIGVLVAVGAVTGTVLSSEMDLLRPGLMRAHGAVAGFPVRRGGHLLRRDLPAIQAAGGR
jgi:hypothetical protein